MTILEHNLENISSQAQVSMGDLGERILKAKEGVDGVLEKMREQEMILLEKKRKIEEIAVMCEESGNDKIISFAKLLRETWDINTKDDQGWTILMNAVLFVYTKIVDMVTLHPDTKINEADTNGFTALICAAWRWQIDVVKTLLEDPRMNVYEHGQLVASYRLTVDEKVKILIKDKLDFYHIDLSS